MVANDDEIRPIVNAEVDVATDDDGDDQEEEEEEEARNRHHQPTAAVGEAAVKDPRRGTVRFAALFLMCLLGFGSTFCYDGPGALQDALRQDMAINTAQFANLYAWYRPAVSFSTVIINDVVQS